MTEIGIVKITELATRQGYSRYMDPTLEIHDVLEDKVDDALLPDTIEIDVRISPRIQPISWMLPGQRL